MPVPPSNPRIKLKFECGCLLEAHGRAPYQATGISVSTNKGVTIYRYPFACYEDAVKELQGAAMDITARYSVRHVTKFSQMDATRNEMLHTTAKGSKKRKAHEEHIQLLKAELEGLKEEKDEELGSLFDLYFDRWAIRIMRRRV